MNASPQHITQAHPTAHAHPQELLDQIEEARPEQPEPAPDDDPDKQELQALELKLIQVAADAARNREALTAWSDDREAATAWSDGARDGAAGGHRETPLLQRLPDSDSEMRFRDFLLQVSEGDSGAADYDDSADGGDIDNAHWPVWGRRRVDTEEDLAASNIPLFAFARGFSHVAFSFTARGELRKVNTFNDRWCRLVSLALGPLLSKDSAWRHLHQQCALSLVRTSLSYLSLVPLSLS